MVEKFEAVIDFLMHNKPILFTGIAIYVALVIKEYSKIKMELKILENELKEAKDEEIREVRTMHADLLSRGVYQSSIRPNNEAEIAKKWLQRKNIVEAKINDYKILRFIAWIPLISGLVSKKEKE